MTSLLLAIVLVASCGGGTDTSSTTAAPSDATVVQIQGFRFGPGDLTVPVGSTVRWINLDDGVGHTATAEGGRWASGTLNPDDSFSFTFDEAGTFDYFCSIHPSMHAGITVTG